MVEVGIVVVMLVGLLTLCWRDPGGYYAAEVKRRAAERAGQRPPENRG